MNGGVYGIFCKITAKPYIGSSKNFKARWKEHVRDLKKQRHHSIKLQRAWNKYGPEAFIFCALEYGAKNLLDMEQIHLDAWDAYRTGYNCSPLAYAPSFKGGHHSEETKEMLRALRHTDETKEFIRAYALAHPEEYRREMTSERRASIGNSLLGLTRTPENCANISKGKQNKRTSIATEFKPGHEVPRETRIAISTALKDRPWSLARRKAQGDRNVRLQIVA